MLSVVEQWLQQQRTGFSAEGIHQLICQWDIHLTARGDYFLQPLLICPIPNGFWCDKFHTIHQYSPSSNWPLPRHFSFI